ncbi:MAG: methyltransferase domain-containing protein [Candidatus Acetothermia bacterium]|jgi:SAM-dependent methyltransferase|nr:methyltransferase domain-containing protein [Candidatus Acetothermia bacterium]MDH7504683.1 methyltransferase domain-containing protein [Candidatus Acetothermia bacterium]
MKTDFEREKRWWDAKAPKEEQDLADEAINRALRWREIERHLEGVETILDVGAGTGAFSIPLAQRGFSVTHLDFSPAMLEIAYRKARHLRNIRFVEANSVALPFLDGSFDLVLNMDGAISFCGSEAEQAILESCRVTKKRLIITVSHRAWMVAVMVSSSLGVAGRLLPAVYSMLDRGEWHQEQFPENRMLAKGMTQDYFGAFKAFLPGELVEILEQAGMRVLRIGGLGSLANLCGKETAECTLREGALFQEFLALCERFDREILPDGPGTRQRAGLIAVAEPVR